MNISFGYDYKGFSGRVSMLYKTDVFTKTDFWPELRESTDDYMRGNLLLSEVKAEDVAKAFFHLAVSKKTTGAILTVDGGNIAASLR